MLMMWCGNTAGVLFVPSCFCSCWKWKLYPPPPPTTELVSRKLNRRQSVKLFCQNTENVNSSYDFDPELRSALELATQSELCEIQTILFGPSYLSPLLKSITLTTPTTTSMVEQDIQLRQQFIATLESRFFYLAADARSTLRGWRPTYRNVLLQLRNKLSIPCSTKLSTHDLELEIFLHLLHYNSDEESENDTALLDVSTESDAQGTLQLGLNQWKMQSNVGKQDFQSLLLKGGSILTLAKIYQLLARKLSGKLIGEAANYQVKKELLKKGGQLALINLESRTALLAAKQGFLGAASRYLGFRSVLTLLGPVLWGTFLADLVIQMLGTDYARILRTIYALAQIRVIRTYKLPSDIAEE
ncbi:uncharacterized protein LOC131603926 isoform X1 [Vicia villosa]|uniref:uncharacterized protein LOC131603926 isoform X1 n=2 Tax=Vicia villosa TaxID=3911 RepID=UPI00273CADFE|nr:uncharacterized protein LOC131603926 isoform X1 [Vicia villosa]